MSTKRVVAEVFTVAFPYWSSNWTDAVRTLTIVADSPVEEQDREPTPPTHDRRGVVFWVMAVIPIPATVGEAVTVIDVDPVWVPVASVAVKSVVSASNRVRPRIFVPST